MEHDASVAEVAPCTPPVGIAPAAVVDAPCKQQVAVEASACVEMADAVAEPVKAIPDAAMVTEEAVLEEGEAGGVEHAVHIVGVKRERPAEEEEEEETMPELGPPEDAVPEYLQGVDTSVIDAEELLSRAAAAADERPNDIIIVEVKTEAIGSEQKVESGTAAPTEATVAAAAGAEKEGGSQKETMTDSEYESGSGSDDSSDSDSNDSSDEEEDSEDEQEMDLADVPKLLREVQDELDDMDAVAAKTQNELTLEDLPPEEPISIELPPHAEMVCVGKISAIVDGLYVVEARPGSIALDLETILWFDREHAAGRVFDVFGPVEKPFYAFRLDPARADMADDAVGRTVSYVANIPDLSKFVLTSQLKMQKGSDASWKYDEEPPPEEMEYSDDEEEQRAKQEMKQSRMDKRQNRSGGAAGASGPSPLGAGPSGAGGRGGARPHRLQPHFAQQQQQQQPQANQYARPYAPNQFDLYGNPIGYNTPSTSTYTPLERPAYVPPQAQGFAQGPRGFAPAPQPHMMAQQPGFMPYQQQQQQQQGLGAMRPPYMAQPAMAQMQMAMQMQMQMPRGGSREHAMGEQATHTSMFFGAPNMQQQPRQF